MPNSQVYSSSRGELIVNDIYDSRAFRVVLNFRFGDDVTKPVNVCSKAPLVIVKASDRL